MKTMAVKFCGGCNPTYDRLPYWEKIKAATEGSIRWVGSDYEDPDGMLIIAGCHAACPEKHFDASDYGLYLVVRDEGTAPGEIIDRILAWGEQKSGQAG